MGSLVDHVRSCLEQSELKFVEPEEGTFLVVFGLDEYAVRVFLVIDEERSRVEIYANTDPPTPVKGFERWLLEQNPGLSHVKYGCDPAGDLLISGEVWGDSINPDRLSSLIIFSATLARDFRERSHAESKSS
ncbi:MAG TPA: hypothetical protein ENF83_04010 [Candidatus Korarchaeota archaeon]|nr:hypothetical protein [Candidatus Korarchaeota archaeon]